MAFQKFTYNRLLAWVGIFLCLVIAQLSFAPKPKDIEPLSESQRNLLENAAVPIYLSENPAAAIRQLESLIQETDIRQIRAYTADQKLVAQVVNASVPEYVDQTRIQNLSIVFQGTMAGSVQLDIGYRTPESNYLETILAILLKSALITLIAWLACFVYLWLCGWLLPKLDARQKQPGHLDEEQTQSPTEASSLLLYLYPLPEQALQENPDILREALSSFSRKLDSHLRIYGGRVLSLAPDCLVCRMPHGQSPNDLQQALTFCWGIARPMIYQSAQGKYQLQIKTLLHKTHVAARAGSTYRAISEIGSDLRQATLTSSQSAHMTKDALSALEPTLSAVNFNQVQSKEHPELCQILSVKKSVDRLWQKQEAMVAANMGVSSSH